MAERQGRELRQGWAGQGIAVGMGRQGTVAWNGMVEGQGKMARQGRTWWQGRIWW
jgi:hypothetical protein